jgi:catalase
MPPEKRRRDHCPLTTATGSPVADNQNSLSAGPRGPPVPRDLHLTEKLAAAPQGQSLSR